MQIDFHHGTIYVLARIAGFSKEDSERLSYASQYVDDAVHGGLIHFENGALFKRTITAHKTLDMKNLNLSDNLDIWLPFHFLPGNVEGATPSKSFIHRLVAKPDSPVAQLMIDEAIRQASKPYGFHRFGIALHVYADTWAHQGFAGIIHEINEVEDPQELRSREKVSWTRKIWDSVRAGVNDIIDDVAPPIGHGRACILPDLPYISWSYTDGRGEKHSRDNWKCFREAAEHILEAMRRYLEAAGLRHESNALDTANLDQIEHCFTSFKDEKGEDRHKAWLEAISNGTFKVDGSPLQDKISYYDQGKNSWRYKALGRLNHNNDCYRYRNDFLTSDWKCFHDAAMAHRFYVLHELLPNCGICAG